MYAVMFGRVEYPFERSEMIDDSRVYPQLIDQIELMMSHVVGRRYEESERQIKRLKLYIN